MSSIVRGQANLHDSIESNSSNTSNKRKRVTHQNPSTLPNIHLTMHPPHASQDLTDHHHLQKQEHADDEEQAAALLHHMHLMHPDDRPHVSAQDHMHDDYHHNGHAVGDHHHVPADHHMVHLHRAHRQIARENSGSSDASATNYFSGDSDLTAEPIMGCTADEDGAKSSNSGSSTPFKVSRRVSPSDDQAQALTAGGGQEYPINPPPHHVENTCNDKEEAAQMSPTSVMPRTSTTSTSMRSCKTFPDSKPFASSQMMQMHTIRTMTDGVCHGPQAEAEVADSRRGSESWLELRLGFSTELEHQLTKNLDASISVRDGGGTSGESLDVVSESTLVTLQLLPGNSKVMEMSAGAAGVSRPGTVGGSGLYGNLPPVYHPTAASVSHMRPKLDENHHTIARFVPPDHQQVLANQSKDPAAAALQPSEHQRFLLSQSNDPSVDFHQSNQRSALPGYDSGIIYNQMQGYVDSNDQRRWLAAETSDMMMMAAPTMIAAARPTEIYRPTASLGWQTGNADTRSWSANSYTPPVQLQRTMSWQGLLRSMTTDGPLLHPAMPDLPMCSFDAGTELSASRGRRHMFPAASTNRPPSGPTTPANHQRLRLATSRRSAGLWFSLQEARHFSNENGEDQEEQHSMQKVYLRIRDGKMQISVLQSYLIRKLESCGSHHYEVEITCRGKTLAPTLTIQHVRDTIWLSKDFELNEAVGFRYTNSYLNESHNRVMALCYQRHNTQTVTLNLLKT